MVDFKAFKGWRPPAQLAKDVASVPYDVLSTAEAREIISGNPKSMMRVIRPDGELPEGTSLYSEAAYKQAASAFDELIEARLLIQDEAPHFYVYAQQMGTHRQVGLMGLGSTQDYLNDRIKKHEFTRPEKENDRVRHIETVGAHLGPVFLSYRGRSTIDELVASVLVSAPTVSFTAEDDIMHELWAVSDPEIVQHIQKAFTEVDAFYIADGHHRAAAASRIGEGYDANSARSSFLVVAFPDHALKILPYNRVVHHLGNRDTETFLRVMNDIFHVTPLGSATAPSVPQHFSMFVDENWYELTFRDNRLTQTEDAVKGLDVSLLQDHVLAPLLGIDDPRTSTDIEFVGGIRGLRELEKRARSYGGVAFAMYPTSMSELLSVADSGSVMPPKSTWFEPKLRTGMVVNRFRP